MFRNRVPGLAEQRIAWLMPEARPRIVFQREDLHRCLLIEKSSTFSCFDAITPSV